MINLCFSSKCYPPRHNAVETISLSLYKTYIARITDPAAFSNFHFASKDVSVGGKVVPAPDGAVPHAVVTHAGVVPHDCAVVPHCIAGSCIGYIRIPQSQKTMYIC